MNPRRAATGRIRARARRPVHGENTAPGIAGEAKIRRAAPRDARVVTEILLEAARWLEQSGAPMWKGRELDPSSVAADVRAGLVFLAERSGDAAGTVRFQLQDPAFWPDEPGPDAAYIHRLAVRRRHAGTGVSAAILRWAVGRTRGLGRRYLRLDCEASRPRLRALYESFGFRHHSDRHVGPYHVSRYEYDIAKGATPSRADPRPAKRDRLAAAPRHLRSA